MLTKVLEHVDNLLYILDLIKRECAIKNTLQLSKNVYGKKALANEYKYYMSPFVRNIFHVSKPVVISLCGVKSVTNAEENDEFHLKLCFLELCELIMK